MKKTIGIVGTGRTIGIANDHLAGIQSVANWRLTAVFDLFRENSESFVKRHNLSDSLICSSLKELLERVEAVVICTDNGSHAEIAKAAFAENVHVLCEKPLSTNYKAAKELAVIAEKSGLVHYMGMQYRYHPYAQLIKEAIDSKEIGDLVFYRHRIGGWRIGSKEVGLEWRMQKEASGAGAVADFGVHQIDLLYYFFQKQAGSFQHIQSELGTYIDLRKKIGEAGHGLVSNDDVGTIIGKLENGAIVNFTSSRILPPDGHGLEIVGTKASIWMDGMENVYIRKRNDDGQWENEKQSLHPEEHHHFTGAARGKQYEEFLDIIQNQKGNELDFHYGAETLRVIDAAVKSSEEGRRVSIKEITCKKQEHNKGEML